MDKIVALAKRRGFIYPGSEIYGGLTGTWDYGPTGSLMKKNLKDLWWREMVQLRDDIVGIDAAIMMNPKAWEASGHVEAFTDPLVECKKCHKRFRKDKFEEYWNTIEKHTPKDTGSLGINYESSFHCLDNKRHNDSDLTEERKFNLLVKAYLGIVEGKQSEIYLRGEITNGVHVNFKNVMDSTRVKIPFGIAQIGKAFRNEITPGNFTFRSREFEQMEVQYYIEPKDEDGQKWFEYWKQNRMDFYLSLGIRKEKVRFRDHAPDERAHYAKAATDIEYEAPWGWQEFMGIHHRGDWDLSRHQKYSGQNLEVRNQSTGKSYLPWDIETSAGVDRSFLFLLIDAYREEEGRLYLKLDPRLAPYKMAVFPLLANKPDLVDQARKLYESLKPYGMIAWDDRGNIGKRYASQDEIGTPYCVTVDFQTLEDNTVTLRNRDTATQTRIALSKVSEHIQKL